MSDDTILQIYGLKKYFPVKGGMFGKIIAHVKAVENE